MDLKTTPVNFSLGLRDFSPWDFDLGWKVELGCWRGLLVACRAKWSSAGQGELTVEAFPDWSRG